MNDGQAAGQPQQRDLDYVRLARTALPLLRFMVSGYKQIDLAAFEEDPRRLAGPVSIQRQIESIESAVKLSEAELGHMAAAFIRASCEELIWLRYLYTLRRDDARTLLLKLSLNDSGRSVQALRDYAGTDAMVGMGWPSALLGDLDALVEGNRNDLKAIAKELGWPGPKPNLQWLADSVGKGNFYAYLYAATSRANHFSAAEVFRRLWFESRTGPISVGHPAHRSYLTNFACDTLLRICMMTLADLTPQMEFEPEAEGDLQAAEEMAMKFAAVSTELQALGKVPIIRPEEFNLLQGPIPD
ncbi:DUF5677 domain-containing protein [Kribbella sp. CA-245084]|uniref:DUF5677 domain-containing protein n=1 Tax=Kribbella sp. CA-245084 TaxID=3239940 RepID=UPI003D8C4DD6